MNKQPSTEIFSSRQFPQWLAQQNFSIALTTYQTGQLFFLGGNESGELQGFQRLYDRAMGLYATPERIYLSCKYQLWQLDNVLTPGQLHQGYDKLYIPRIGYTTGDLDIHDVTVDKDGKIIFVSTLLNCLATVSDHKSCKPLWKPSFISRVINEDRCHLNGLAMVDGEPGFVTACSQSDLVDGWRDRRIDGGIVIDVASNEIICIGLSMPHSPRWYQGKLWLHNSGRGELGYVDLSRGKFEPIAFCPGYLRGLAFWDNYAIVGLSKPRNGDKTFSGLPLDDLLQQKDGEARCGLMVVDLDTGAIIHWLRLEGKITELYDVQVIPDVKRPMALGFQTEEIAQLISLESSEAINNNKIISTTKNDKKLVVISKHHDGGFFSNFNKVIHLIKKYDRGYDFKVDWTFRGSEIAFRYGDVIGENIWNLFFEPLPFNEEIEYSKTIFLDRYLDYSITHVNAHNLYLNQNFTKVRNLYHEIYHKYIKIKPDILAEVNNFFDTHLAGNICLGVHKRHVLHYREEHSKKVVPIGDYLEVIKQLMSQSGAEKIFLATDEKEAVEAMKQAFGDRLICRQDIIRASVSESQEMHWQAKNSGSRLGREVLIDALLLAKCNIFLHGLSNISTAVSFVNPDLKMVYLYADKDGNTKIVTNQKNISFKPEAISPGRQDLEVKIANAFTEKQDNLQEEKNQRQQLAKQWLDLPLEQLETSYAREIGKAHREIINSNLKYELLSTEEEIFVEELISSLIQNPQQLQYLLAVMLYLLPHQLPSRWYESVVVPAWLTNDYLAYMLEYPQLFKQVGEVDNYYYYMRDWVTFIYSKIKQNPQSQSWHHVACFLAENAVLISLYFNDFNLKDICQKWADTTELAMIKQGFAIDYQFAKLPVKQKKIRLGVINQAFITHSEVFITLPFFEYLDRDLFEIILYAKHIRNRPLEKYCQTRSDRLVELPENLHQAADLIRSDDLDILFIGTNIAGGRKLVTLLAMHRLARVQVTSFACSLTTGIRNIDYYISGSFTEPQQGAQEQYREKLILLEGSGYCFSNKHRNLLKTSGYLASKNLEITTDKIVFISGANFYKIIPELRETWAKVLAAVPNSVLVLYPFSNWSTSYPINPFLKQIEAIFTKYGVDSSRLIILPRLANREEVKVHLQLADIYLDAYPYTGGTSIFDPLEVGLPPVVRCGNSFRSRQAAAILRDIDMTGLIAESETEYLNLAISLGNNPELRNSYRQAIKDKIANNPPFFDGQSFSKNITKLFQQLLQTWEDNNNNIHVSLPSSPVNQTNTPEELFNRSRILKQQGNLEQAEACLRQAINLKPDYLIAYNNLGTLLQNQGNITEAKQCYQKVLQLNPNLAETISNLASIWQLEEDVEKAKTGYYRALQLKSDYVPAHFNLANIFQEQKRLAAAAEHFEKVIALEPNYTEAYFNLAGIYDYRGNFAQALKYYHQADKLAPDDYYTKTLINYINRKLCNWENYHFCIQESIELVTAHLTNPKSIISPFSLSTFPVPLELHQAFAKKKAEGINLKVAPIKERLKFQHSTNQPQKLRIGYISPDFRNHAVGRLIYQIFSHHDRSQFEIYGYTTVDMDDHITKEIRSRCDVFVDLSPLSTEAAARRIYSDGIHILIDLAGYTIGNGANTLALQPAPIQAQWLGYPDTMGAEFMQYYLGDRTLITPEIAQHYTEEIIYLPHTFVASPLTIADKVMTRSEFGLPEDAFVFCCFNSHYKITPEVFDVWMRILQQVPNSILWLGSGQGQDNLIAEAKQRGIAANRLIFAEKIPHDEYLARYSLVDLYLDTFIYNAGSTAAAVLWTGLPLLTHPGNTNASRMGASICAAAELESMICTTIEEYEQKAVHLATNPEQLAQIRQELQEKLQSETTYPPLFQVEHFVRSLENAFQQMWQKFCDSK